jgi:NADH-quinone oxidoreductase subunit M
MALVLLLLIPTFAAAILLAGGRRCDGVAAPLAIGALLADLGVGLWLGQAGQTVDFQAPWIPSLGVSFHLTADGLSRVLAMLALGLGLLAAWLARTEIRERVAHYQGLLLLTVAAMLGVFLASDLFLFFLFFEAMLLPSVLLLAGWGRGESTRVAFRFFLFTQLGGLAMMVSIAALYFAAGSISGVYTLDYAALLQTPVAGPAAFWIMLGFVAAFAVKLPLAPFHGWQPATYAAAPASLAVLLAGVMAKTGAYGFVRYAIPLFPEPAREIAPWMMGLGVAAMLYGAVIAFGQDDLRRMLAYSSMSHLGLVVAGAYSMNGLGYHGAVVQMVAHGLSISGLFLIVHALEQRRRSTAFADLGGLWQGAPRLGAFGILFAMATLGLPGLGNFVGEILVLLGVYAAWPKLAILAVLAPVVGALYCLRLVQRVFLGPRHHEAIGDPGWGGLLPAALLAIALIGLGFYPGCVLREAEVPAAWQAAPAVQSASLSSEPISVPLEERAR